MGVVVFIVYKIPFDGMKAENFKDEFILSLVYDKFSHILQLVDVC